MRHQQLFLDGQWVPTDVTKPVTDAWGGAAIGTVAVAGGEHAKQAVDAAYRAKSSSFTIPERAAVLERTATIIENMSDVFANTIRAEVGKPISAARMEVQRAIGTIRLAAEESQRLPSHTVPLDAIESGQGTLAFTVPVARGVVAAITPFNFPLNLVAHKVGPAIAAGCPIVLKPSDRAPHTAGLLVEALTEAGLPEGWINLVTGPAQEIVDTWQEDDRVEIVTFTGSSRIGWQLKSRSPRKLHILELGSNTAMVIDRSADLSRAVNDAVSSAFANSGQACVSLQRIYVHAGVADAFVGALADAVGKVPFGDPNDAATVVGPLITPADADRISTWIEDAVASGAEVLVGGKREGSVVTPTLLRDAPADSAIMCDEAFGPVVTVNSVADLDEAIAAVNASDFGLNTSIYTSDLGSAMRYAAEAESGTVLVNVPPAFRADHMPYGGVKDSGQGTEGVKYAIHEMVREKLVILKP